MPINFLTNFSKFMIIRLTLYFENIMSSMIQPHYSITAENIYNIVNRNYQWEDFKYQVPKVYHSKRDQMVRRSKRPNHKKNYIDDVLKMNQWLPSPCAYELKQNIKPIFGKMDKNPRRTIAEDIIHRNKSEKSPGPAEYFNRPQTAGNKLNTNAPQYRDHYLNEIQYQSSQCPGAGEYNVSQFAKHITSPKYVKYHHKSRSSVNLHSKKENRPKILNQQLSKTVVIGTFDWIASQKKTFNKNYFGSSKRFKVANKVDKNPAPNLYKLNKKWTDSTNLQRTLSGKSIKRIYY